MSRLMLVLSTVFDLEAVFAVVLLFAAATTCITCALWMFGKQPKAVRRDIIRLVRALRRR